MSDLMFQVAHHAEKITHLLQAGHLQAVQQYQQQLDADVAQLLAPWLSQYLAHAQTAEPVAAPVAHLPANLDTPACVLARNLGWQLYLKHDYVAAHAQFSLAFSLDAASQPAQNYASDVALGLAKVYTRSGHWQAARQWCLYYLKMAREQNNTFEVCKGYGALAEIFLRAGHSQQALACFQLAYHLMPVGQGQQARQFNFMASALMRNGEWLRAETLLHTSLQMSRQQLALTNDHDWNNRIKDPFPDATLSFMHSIMRSAYLRLAKTGEYKGLFCEFAMHKLRGMQSSTGAAGIPHGHLRMLAAFTSLQYGFKDVAQHVESALTCYAQPSLAEYYWGLKVMAFAQQQQQPAIPEPLQAVLNIVPQQPPKFDVVLDQTWLQPELNNNGFAALFAAQDTWQDVARCWRMFFI